MPTVSSTVKSIRKMAGVLRARTSAIFFDLGSAGTRMCQLRRAPTGMRAVDALALDASLLTAATADVPAGCDEQRLGRVVEQGRFSGRDAGLLLPTHAVQFHTLRLADAVLDQPQGRVVEAVRWEIGRDAREDGPEIEVRYWRLPPSRQGRHNLMAVTVRSQDARDWVARFAAAGLHLRHIEPAPCAIVRCAAELWPVQASDVWGVIDLGWRQSTLAVVHGSTPVYIRPAPATLEGWSRLVSERLDLGIAEASRLLSLHGLTADESGETDSEAAPDAGGSQGDMSMVLFNLLRDELGSLAREVGRCLTYVMAAYPESSVVRIGLAGGGAHIRGLAEYLELQFSTPVTPVASDGPPAVQPTTAGAVGGALLDLED